MRKRVQSLALLLLPLVALLVLLVTPTAALGQGDEIHVVSQDVESDFPNTVTFKLTATSPDTIEEIRVFLKPVGSERSTYGYVEIEPGLQVFGQHVMKTGTGTGHKPPGTVIRYSFEIRDSAGRVLRTDEEEYLYIDSRLEWKQISDGLLTVYYYGDFVEKRAKEVLDTSLKSMEQMGGLLGIQPEEPINIVSYSNYRDLARALPFQAQAVREDLRTEGQAYVNERVLLVLAADADFVGVASHEFTHILVAEAAGRGYARVPSWLNEGLAEFGNLDPTPHYDWALNYAAYTRRLKPLWHLERLSGDPDEIIILYGQGKSAVRYLIGTYGVEKMADLMRAFRTSLSADEAFQNVYGFDQRGLDAEWRISLGLKPLPASGELAEELTPTPSPTPGAGVEATLAPAPQAEANPTPVPEATPESPASSDRGGRTSRGCSARSGDTAGLPLDVAMLALLGGPFFALNIGWSRRKGRFIRGLGALRRVAGGLRNRRHSHDR